MKATSAAEPKRGPGKPPAGAEPLNVRRAVKISASLAAAMDAAAKRSRKPLADWMREALRAATSST